MSTQKETKSTRTSVDRPPNDIEIATEMILDGAFEPALLLMANIVPLETVTSHFLLLAEELDQKLEAEEFLRKNDRKDASFSHGTIAILSLEICRPDTPPISVIS